MTVSTTSTKVTLSGNGSTHSFAFNFKIFADVDLKVIVRSATGTETTKTLGTHYVITGTGAESGGNVLFKFNTGTTSDAHYSTSDFRPASGESVIIKRVLTLTQSTDYVENDSFSSTDHENALDRLTMATQQLQEELDRKVGVSETTTITNPEITGTASDRAQKLLGFSSDGNSLEATEGRVATVTVSTGAAGSSATATFTASSGALALAIPRGDTGATGATGSATDDAELSAIAGLTSAAGKMIEFTGSGTAQVIDVTTAGKALMDDADASAQRTTMGVAIGSDVQAFDADILKADTADNLTAGFSTTVYDAGTKSSGTYTPDQDDGNIQKAVNGGAHTLAPTEDDCAVIIQYTNNASAGTITTSGFTLVDGDDISTTNGDDFFFYLTKANGFSLLTVKALQ